MHLLILLYFDRVRMSNILINVISVWRQNRGFLFSSCLHCLLLWFSFTKQNWLGSSATYCQNCLLMHLGNPILVNRWKRLTKKLNWFLKFIDVKLKFRLSRMSCTFVSLWACHLFSLSILEFVSSLACELAPAHWRPVVGHTTTSGRCKELLMELTDVWSYIGLSLELPFKITKYFVIHVGDNIIFYSKSISHNQFGE